MTQTVPYRVLAAAGQRHLREDAALREKKASQSGSSMNKNPPAVKLNEQNIPVGQIVGFPYEIVDGY